MPTDAGVRQALDDFRPDAAVVFAVARQSPRHRRAGSRSGHVGSCERRPPLWRDSPSPSMPSATTSPAFRYTGDRLHAEPDARGRSSADDVAGQQRHELADVADQRRHGEDHIGGGAVLPHRAVDRQPHAAGARGRASRRASRGRGRAARTCRRSCPSPIGRRARAETRARSNRCAACSPAMCSPALLARDVAVRAPMTTASSTSQSSFVALRGIDDRIVRSDNRASSP